MRVKNLNLKLDYNILVSSNWLGLLNEKCESSSENRQDLNENSLKACFFIEEKNNDDVIEKNKYMSSNQEKIFLQKVQYPVWHIRRGHEGNLFWE